MNQVTRLSPVVIDHIRDLLEPMPVVNAGITVLRPTHKQNLSARENQLFWRYHGHFPQEFVKAVQSILPNHYHFVEYDHLKNELKVEVR